MTRYIEIIQHELNHVSGKVIYMNLTVIFEIIFAVICLVVGLLQFFQVGKPISREYRNATDKEREEMNIKQMFRQSAGVLIGLAVVFVFNAVYEQTSGIWAKYATWACLILTLVLSVVIRPKE